MSSSKGPDKPLTIAIEPLGYQELPPKFRSTVATMLTLHFVDEQHLLFTFTKRTLMPRLPDAQPEDDDRNVEAVLLELPTGKVLAETQWRTRDHDRYLWPLGRGRFLLRIRSKLTVLDPLRELADGHPANAFAEQQFVDFHRPIGYIHVSPDGELIGIETLNPRKPKLTGVTADAAALAATQPGYKKEPELQVKGHSPVQIYFFRLSDKDENGHDQLYAKTAGLVGAPALINLPATGDGYLDVQQDAQSKGATWLFDFVSHAGKRMELSAFDTSCAPRPYFVSRSEFVAFGCRGGTDKAALSYFNLKGDEPWIAVLGGTHVSPQIVSAPGAGRFAMSRTLVSSVLYDVDALTADDLTAQEISVIQNHDGHVLLKVMATPIQRTGQNFDLSPSGMRFAVLRNGNLEVYELPKLTGKDQKAVELAAAMNPEKNDAMVRLNSVPVDERVSVETEQPKDNSTAAVEAKKAEREAKADSAVVGDPQSDERAKGVAEALPAGEAVGTGSRRASEIELGDVQGKLRQRPSLYTEEYPRGKDDPKPAKKEEMPQ